MDLKINKELKNINDVLASCHRVKETVDTKGWQEIIEPTIDKMIHDLLGAKVNGRWQGGILDRARKDEKREYYIGYKQALIDLHTRVYAYLNNINVLEDKKKFLIEEQKNPKFTTPMVDDSSYVE